MKRSMTKIGLITPGYAPRIGGVERHTEALTRGLVARGLEVEVITTDAAGNLPQYEVRDGVTVRRFRTIGPRGAYFVSPSMGAWLMRNAASFDLLHGHSYHALPALHAGIAAAWNKVPFVFTAHYHGTGHSTVQRALHKPYRLMGRWLVDHADRVLCVSEVERQLLEQHFGPSDTRIVIPNGVDVADLLAAHPLANADQRVLILVVGRLEVYKQVDQLVRAIPYLPANYEVVIVGEGPARDVIEGEAQRLGVQQRLRMLGRLPQDELLSWYRTANVVVSLSQRESFGITLLEGAVAGASVVASNIPAHHEVAGYVPSDRITFVGSASSPQELAQTIIASADCGRATGTDTWSLPTWSGMVDGAVACYRSILEGDGLMMSQGVTV